MNRGSRQIWRQGVSFFAMLASMAVGIIFGILGKNPFDPDNLFWKNPQNISFLWISTIAFFIAAALSCTIWLLVKVEAARKDIPVDQKTSSLWYRDRDTAQVNRLSYLVFYPSVSIRWALGNLAAISHLEVFSWLNGVVLLIVIVTDILALVYYFKGYRERAQERTMR
ncbi:hypothetical protein [Ktedonobacter sp. SOSP1-85]|uniref:hypothetical protein n=1 Tax=Ktedonobacter sp. SOSP1-85 TaxID=2778367 RepID=UPI001914F182|nr:hypothetical protein [Ktedonobacter sp. SOSP1-85]